jgi:hypothetical protein
MNTSKGRSPGDAYWTTFAGTDPVVTQTTWNLSPIRSTFCEERPWQRKTASKRDARPDTSIPVTTYTFTPAADVVVELARGLTFRTPGEGAGT